MRLNYIDIYQLQVLAAVDFENSKISAEVKAHDVSEQNETGDIASSILSPKLESFGLWKSCAD